MPYYQEWFINEAITSRRINDDYLTMLDQKLVTSFRTRPHPKAISRRELLDITVDPYAYFLTSIERKKYLENVSSRGLSAAGVVDNGHPFESISHTIKTRPRDFLAPGNNWKQALFGYTGSELNGIHNGNHTQIPSFGSDTLNDFGRRAFARVAPTSVIFDAANFLGELRERLPSLVPHLIKDQSVFFKGIGKDYLNVVFGWVPFVADIQRAALALLTATQELSNQGELKYRSFGLPPVFDTATTDAPSTLTWNMRVGGMTEGLVPIGFPIPKTVLGHPTPLYDAGSSTGFDTRWAQKSRERRQWFEGVFSSFYPLNFDPSSYIERANILVNTKVTPEVLWNLTPWTWLVDWQLRISDSIRSNQLRANDLLVMHYGYAMETSVYTTASTASVPTFLPNPYPRPYEVSMIARTVRKRRIRANPYGFGIGGAEALNPVQLSILGALGLTKLNR